jgi:hypothetical protein
VKERFVWSLDPSTGSHSKRLVDRCTASGCRLADGHLGRHFIAPEPPKQIARRGLESFDLNEAIAVASVHRAKGLQFYRSRP